MGPGESPADRHLPSLVALLSRTLGAAVGRQALARAAREVEGPLPDGLRAEG